MWFGYFNPFGGAQISWPDYIHLQLLEIKVSMVEELLQRSFILLVLSLNQNLNGVVDFVRVFLQETVGDDLRGLDVIIHQVWSHNRKVVGHHIKLCKYTLLEHLVGTHLDNGRAHQCSYEIAWVDDSIAKGPPWHGRLGSSNDSELEQSLAWFLKDGGHEAWEVPVGKSNLLFKRYIFSFLNAPLLLQFMHQCIRVKILWNAIQFNSFDEIFTELHQWVPFWNALNKSGVFLRFFDDIEVLTNLLWQSHVVCITQIMLKIFFVILSYQYLVKLLVE